MQRVCVCAVPVRQIFASHLYTIESHLALIELSNSSVNQIDSNRSEKVCWYVFSTSVCFLGFQVFVRVCQCPRGSRASSEGIVTTSGDILNFLFSITSKLLWADNETTRCVTPVRFL